MGAVDIGQRWANLRSAHCDCLFCLGGYSNYVSMFDPQTALPLFDLAPGWIHYETVIDNPTMPGGLAKVSFIPMRPGCIVLRNYQTGNKYTIRQRGIIIPADVFRFNPVQPYAYEDDIGLKDKLLLAINYPSSIHPHPFSGRQAPVPGQLGRSLPRPIITPTGCTTQGQVNAINSVWCPTTTNTAAKEPAKTGFRCTECGEENPYASANQPNGTYVCSYHGVKLFT